MIANITAPTIVVPNQNIVLSILSNLWWADLAEDNASTAVSLAVIARSNFCPFHLLSFLLSLSVAKPRIVPHPSPFPLNINSPRESRGQNKNAYYVALAI